MALTFGGATTDRVDCGHTSPINDLTTFTILAWVFVTTRTSGRSFFTKGNTGGAGVVTFSLSGTSGAIQSTISQSTSPTVFISSSTPVATNTWTYVAATYDVGASPRQHIYSGTLTAEATEVTYSSSADGSGTKTAEGAVNGLVWGNNLNGASAYARALQGKMARCQYYNRVLTLGEILVQQFRAKPTNGCVNYLELGFNGTSTQPDWSGNNTNGTVTGATQSDGAPLGPPFGTDIGFGGNYLPNSRRSGFFAFSP